jgi:hypothetical protein
MLPLSGPGTETGISSPITPTTSTTAPTSKINRRKFMRCSFPGGAVSKPCRDRLALGGASTNMLFLFGVVAVA